MIGQEKIRKLIDGLERLPSFILIVGDKGSGKKTVAEYISNKFLWTLYPTTGVSYTVPDVKIATIRDIIANSYKQIAPMLYIVPDIDTMSTEAQNSILKITEEPPNRANFVMTVNDINNVLPTIKSRAYTIYMDRYTVQELDEYLTSTGKHTNADDIVFDICETPGEINTFLECGGKKFSTFVDNVVDNLYSVTTANALKILDSLDLKSEGKGYDVEISLKLFARACLNQEDDNYIRAIFVTSLALTRLRVRGANKNMIMTNWILGVRELWN